MLPAISAGSVHVTEETYQLDTADLYRNAVPHPSLRLSGVEGALHALGAPCAVAEGGVLTPSGDVAGGILFTGIHTVVDAPAPEAARGKAARGKAAGGKAPADEAAPAANAVSTGVSSMSVEMGVPGAAPLAWSIGEYRRLMAQATAESPTAESPTAAKDKVATAAKDKVATAGGDTATKVGGRHLGKRTAAATATAAAAATAGDEGEGGAAVAAAESPPILSSSALRSAVARAMYQGVRVRLQRAHEGPKRKKVKAE